MSDYIPVNSGMGGDALSAGFGAFVGSIFGDAWGSNGFGFNRGSAEGFSTNLLNDGLNNIQQSINQVGRDIASGLSNVGYQSADLNNRTNVAMLQGFNQIGRDMCTSSSAIVSAVNGVGSQVADCCCATQRLIEREGCATRELMQALNTQNIRDQLCDAKAKIATLESNAFTAGALNNAVTTIIKHMPATTTTTTAGA